MCVYVCVGETGVACMCVCEREYVSVSAVCACVHVRGLCDVRETEIERKGKRGREKKREGRGEKNEESES